MTAGPAGRASWADRTYRGLLRCYPRAFRDRFGAEMAELFRTRRIDAARRGPRASARFWWTTLADLARSAMQVRRGSVRSPALPGGRSAWPAGIGDAFRLVRRAPGLGAAIVLLLALTIGAALSMFSVVNAVLLRPLPYPAADRLVTLWETRADGNLDRYSVSGHEFAAWQARSRTFHSLAAVIYNQGTLTGAGQPAALSGARVTASFFDVLGVEPVAGRRFSADDDRPGRGDVVILAHHLWRDRFGGDPAIAGRQVRLDGRPLTVVGVMGADFEFPRNALGGPPDYWMPIAEPIRLYRGRHYLWWVIGRLNPAATVASAQADMDRVAQELEDALPELNRGHDARVALLHDDLVRKARPVLWLLLAAVCCLLAIGCANVAGLLLAHGLARRREIAVRLALGAGRWSVARQLIAESVLLAAAGGIAGLGLALWLIRAATAIVPRPLLPVDAVPLDAAVAAFALAVTFLTGVIFGLGPILQARRLDLSESLKHGGRTLAAAGPPRLRRVLVAAQVAVTVVLVLSAGLLTRSLAALQQVDPGFATASVLAVDVSLPGIRYPGAVRQRQFSSELVARVSSLAGIGDVAVTNAAPLSPARSTIAIDIEGRPPAPGQDVTARYRIVSAGYFRTLGIPVVAGREFLPSDARRTVPLLRWSPEAPPATAPGQTTPAEPPPLTVINQAMAARYWPDRDPIGQRFRVLFSPAVTVVGVVADTRNQTVTEPPAPEFYLHDLQEPHAMLSLLVRAAPTMPPPTAAVQSVIRDLDPELAVSSVRTLGDMANETLLVPRFASRIVGGFAAAALLLMAVGLYGLMAMTTAARLPEMGVRLALGARPGAVVALLVRHGLVLAIAGALFGTLATMPLRELLESQLFGVAPGDPMTWGAAVVVVLLTAGLACWWPARRAGRVDLAALLRRDDA